ncbi:adenylosuccinate synthetase [Virgisporangium ochraceum]|uniref:Adenylosuccinate synthetase n=1 Tax=Virgisporangium ochraceum TaxID=65505 RepID=A0A8J4EEF4_9ACTN|nr:adenylosuccinate synthetase [Virgisporangium ochraceum]GIJ68967.1 adenylosuccinate synthetase [Virgisporangium ochraceum]
MHIVVVDLGFGDAGKGTVVDWLCASRPVRTVASAGDEPAISVVRFNGGGQAAHTVVLPDGRRHTFAQFGSGTLRPGVRTHLSRFMVVDPLALVVEADHLVALGVGDALSRLTVDAGAPLATPYHRAANRARELARGADRHGSCGMGVGETMAYLLAHPDAAPHVGDCRDPELLRHKLSRLRGRLEDELGPLDAPPVDACVDAFTAFASAVSIVDGAFLERLLDTGTVVFEGAQGVLLDEWHGFHPYTTWSTTTFANAEELLAGRDALRLGVLRTFTTRHGPGPLVTEDPALDLTDPHNPTNPWQGPFRVGHFDAVAHRYALDVCGGVDALALTHLDVAGRGVRMCRRYDWTDRLVPGPAGDLDRQEALTRRLENTVPRYDPEPEDWAAAVEEELGAPVAVTSHGPTAADKRQRKALRGLRGGRTLSVSVTAC